ncbi:MAG: hypothetical protein H6642_12375 [Caldilineaceae bacterium]|nr:hypothetical protein [Caldilineaceae bacterium]
MLTLYAPDGGAAVAGISCWRSTYSTQGEGFALAFWSDPGAVGMADLPSFAVFADNAALGRMVMTRFNQYFTGYKDLGLADAAPQQARFLQQFDGPRLHRVTCAADGLSIEIVWRDVLDAALEHFDNQSGAARFDAVTVICPCRAGTITVNGVPLPGEVRLPEGEKTSSAFLAFSETWIAHE